MPRLEEVLDEKLRATEQKMSELAELRNSLLYYRRRAEELNEQIPVERNCEDVSFCGCLEAITSEGGGAAEMIRSHLASALRYAGRASTQGI